MFPSTKSSPYLLQKILNSRFEDQQDGSPSKGTISCQAWQTEFNLWNWHGGRKVSRTLSDNHTRAKDHTHIHTKYMFKHFKTSACLVGQTQFLWKRQWYPKFKTNSGNLKSKMSGWRDDWLQVLNGILMPSTFPVCTQYPINTTNFSSRDSDVSGALDMCMWYTYIQAGSQHIHIKMEKKIAKHGVTCF